MFYIYNSVIFFTLTKSAKTNGQKLEHGQDYINSNGKLALKHIISFPTENADCRIPSPCSRIMTMIFNLFSTSRLSHRKNIQERLLYWHISPFILCGLHREFPKYFQHAQKHIGFTGQSVLVNGKFTLEWGNRINVSISICFGVGARETRLSDSMTLGWKTERPARTNIKMLSTKQASDRSVDSFASCRTPKCEDFD